MFRIRVLIAVLLTAGLACLLHDGVRGQGYARMDGPPGWVLKPPPQVDCNFAGFAYYNCPLDQTLSLTRASSETVTWADGHLSYAGQLAISDLGLQVWEARTNVQVHSQDTTGWGIAAGSVSNNAAVAPDGTTTAIQFTENSANASHSAFAPNATITSNASTAFSLYVKPNGRRYLVVGNSQSSTLWFAATFDLQTGAQSQAGGAGAAGTFTSASIVPSINGWFYITVVGSVTSANGQVQVWPSTSGTFSYGSGGAPPSYTGDGASGVYLWGAQIENNVSFASPYIPTTSASATRALDAVSVIGSALTVLSGSQASYFVNAAGTPSASPVILDKSGAGANIFLGVPSTSQVQIKAQNTAVQATLGSGVTTGATKAAGGFSSAGVSVAANNGTPATSATTIAGTTAPYIGSLAGATFIYNGNVKRLSLWGSRLGDSALQSLTQ